jgi:hypothetical protein
MIRRKNPIFEDNLAYLQNVTPHGKWHYGLMLMVLLVATTFVLRDYHEWDRNAVEFMAIPILSIYWLFQFRIMKSAAYLAHHNWQATLSDELVGAVSQRSVILTKVRAILRHYRFFIVLLSLGLLGLSLALAGFLLFRSTYFPEAFATPSYTSSSYVPDPFPVSSHNMGRGIWKYVGATSTALIIPLPSSNTCSGASARSTLSRKNAMRWPTAPISPKACLIGLPVSLLSVSASVRWFCTR